MEECPRHIDKLMGMAQNKDLKDPDLHHEESKTFILESCPEKHFSANFSKDLFEQ